VVGAAFPTLTVLDGFPHQPSEAPVIDRALSILARLAELLAPVERRPEPIAIPIRRDDRRR
jgi:hypothetical protein